MFLFNLSEYFILNEDGRDGVLVNTKAFDHIASPCDYGAIRVSLNSAIEHIESLTDSDMCKHISSNQEAAFSQLKSLIAIQDYLKKERKFLKFKALQITKEVIERAVNTIYIKEFNSMTGKGTSVFAGDMIDAFLKEFTSHFAEDASTEVNDEDFITILLKSIQDSFANAWELSTETPSTYYRSENFFLRLSLELRDTLRALLEA